MADHFPFLGDQLTKRHLLIMCSLAIFLSMGFSIGQAFQFNTANQLLSSLFTNWSLLTIYFIALSLLALFAFKSKSKITIAATLVVVLLGCAMDVVVATFHAIRLIIRCPPNNYDRMLKHCQSEFGQVLNILKHSQWWTTFMSVSVLHGIVVVTFSGLACYVFRHKSKRFSLNESSN